MCVIALLFCCF